MSFVTSILHLDFLGASPVFLLGSQGAWSSVFCPNLKAFSGLKLERAAALVEVEEAIFLSAAAAGPLTWMFLARLEGGETGRKFLEDGGEILEECEEPSETTPEEFEEEEEMLMVLSKLDLLFSFNLCRRSCFGSGVAVCFTMVLVISVISSGFIFH